MTRFRLNTEESDDESSSRENLAVDLGYSSSDASDSDDDEPDHPLGFTTPRMGHSWVNLDPHPFVSPQRSTGVFSLDMFDSDGDDEDENDPYTGTPKRWKTKTQAYPPYECYLDAKVAPTSALLKYYQGCQGNKLTPNRNDDKRNEVDTTGGIDYITNLYSSISVQEPPPVETIELPPWDLSEANIAQKMKRERARMESEHSASRNGLRKILEDLSRTAKKIHAQNKADQKAQDDADEKHRLQLEKEEDDRKKEQDRRDGEAKEKAERAQAAKDEQVRKDTAQKKAVQEKEAKKVEHITKAKKLVLQLVQLRESIKGFDTSKAVSRRRLNMKKIAGGKLNMLTEDADKIMSVAGEVSGAITAARTEDERVKKEIEAGNTQDLTKDMTRGKRYLIDLVVSKAMNRVQADSFNGPRGDGFPLAAMLAAVSKESQEFVPILAAHIYTVCPAAIPALPASAANVSDDEWMASLGMQKGKNGEFETFDNFLSRTENIIALMADIMSSAPADHILMGGHEGAAVWLKRFLDMIPAAPVSPLPLLTAPVLVAFLSRAGHMLANVHPDSFREQVSFISDDITKRLDESAIGKPSSVRLLKVLEGGFDAFKANLPHKALPPLYVSSPSSKGMALGPSTGQANANPTRSMPSNPFGGSSIGAPQSFSSSQQNSSAPSNPFGGGTTPAPAPFGMAASSTNTNSNPFGGPSAPSPSPFGGGASQASKPPPFGAAAPTQSPFGGGGAATASNAFGTTASNPSPFGASAAATPSPFGAPVGAPAASPFGAPAASNASPFGAPATTNASPFGAPASATNSTPFGGGAAAKASPFGAPAASNPAPFGASVANSNPSPFGAAAPAPSPFGAPTPSPFGAPAGASNPSPFGGGAGNANPSPFGGGNAKPSPFGGGGNQNASFGNQKQGGGGGGKAPCKFFAKGNCRYGDKCRFSHDIGVSKPSFGFGGGGNNSGAGFGSPFGR